ncbi:hypothetical protein HanLR1_Chr07g0238441 [Helianthus annuus]|nr:hypothetical protein HanLR1_Chr07g0238441 [Helianthus annuus]
MLLRLAPILQTSTDSKQKTHVTTNEKMDEKRLYELVRTHIKKWRDKNEKRMAELGDVYRSPYCNRITSLYEPLLERDQTIICYLLAPIGNISSVMYKPKSGVETLKIIFESFHPSQFVASNGMDAFVDVLNFEEKKRDKKSSPYKLFLPSTMIVS